LTAFWADSQNIHSCTFFLKKGAGVVSLLASQELRGVRTDGLQKSCRIYGKKIISLEKNGQQWAIAEFSRRIRGFADGRADNVSIRIIKEMTGLIA